MICFIVVSLNVFLINVFLWILFIDNWVIYVFDCGIILINFFVFNFVIVFEIGFWEIFSWL